jgi:hypothetical protein
MKTEGKTRADMHKKALEYFDLLAGEPRQKAAEEMKAGCKHLGMYALGAEKVKELQQMKDSGATQEEISTKVTEFVRWIIRFLWEIRTTKCLRSLKSKTRRRKR